MHFPIAEWQKNGNFIEPGQYAFPFEIELPDWLPVSAGIAENQHGILMQVKYMLIAQIEGLPQLNILKRPSPKKTLYHSIFRHERPFIVLREQTRQPLTQIEKTLTLKVGGFIGMAATESISVITLEKDQFYPGEDIVV